jgi:hypothetical protein
MTVVQKRALWGIAGIGLVFGGLQFTTPKHANPPVNAEYTIEASMALPPGVSAVFARSCNDCHSSETRWPWYSYVAPASWLVVRDVNKGRDDWNVSEWGSYTARRKETRLRAICTQVQEGTMPPPSYTMVHRDARLQPDDAKIICDWTEIAKQEHSVSPR